MAVLQEVVSWDAGVYQLETSDPVLGGPGGTSNKPAQNLANRTAYLKKHVDDLEGGTTAAGKANKLTTARNIALTGDVTGQGTFDGSANLSIAATYKNSGVMAGTYKSVTVDAKGNVTAGTNPTTLAGFGITDAVPTSQKGAASGVATLDSGGKVPVSQLPATAIVDTFVVSTQTAMLALPAEVGDLAVRTDLNKSFILRVTGASTLANWQELLTPTDAVQSVDGMYGVVVLPLATETTPGKAEVATQTETNTGTDDGRFVTPKKLLAWVKQATESVLGMMKVATQAQTNAGTADDVAVTPKKLRAGFRASLTGNGYIAFPTWLGGLIIQWGTLNVSTIANDNVHNPVTFPIAFTSSTLRVLSTPSNAFVGGFVTTSSEFETTTGFTAVVGSSVASASFKVQWLAIGI